MEDGVDFFTSGSTGNAKPIHKTWQSLTEDVDELTTAFSSFFTEHPLFVATVQRQHMYGTLWLNLIPPKVGCEVYPDTVVSVEELIGICEKHPKILFMATPSFLEKLVQHPERDRFAHAFVGIISSGSLLRTEVSEAVYRCTGVSPTEIFGSTEAGSVGWRRQVNGPAWTLFPRVSVRCLENQQLEVDSPFCLTHPFLMSDAVELLPDRKFLLKGRTDRRVKILEEMVSLPDVEQLMAAHPFVAQAHAVASDETVPRVWALVVLTDAGKAALRQTTYHDLIRQINDGLRSALPGVALPRRVRFLREMPVNPQGKLPRSLVLPILKSKMQEPVVEGWTECDGEISAWLTFPPDSLVFQGHFPGFPVLPGVAQLYWVQRFLRERYRAEFNPVRIRRLKFQRLIRPQERLRLQLRRPSSGRFEFAIVSKGGRNCSSGCFENGMK